MKLIELGEEGLTRLYQKEMTRDFPPQELKPLKAMAELMAQGRYQALGLKKTTVIIRVVAAAFAAFAAALIITY